MSLDEWRALESQRKELRMAVPASEDVTAKKIAEKQRMMDENRLVGMGGGYKEYEGWKCQSFNCTGHINYKNDTICKKCGAARRY